MSGPDLLPYQYVVLRWVPRVEREEFLNVAVVLHCQRADFLALAQHLDRDRLAAFSPGADLDRVAAVLEFAAGVCAGDPARGGTAATHPPGTRFGFLKAPRSTVLQPGPVHGGLATDPAPALDHLLRSLVGLAAGDVAGS